MIGTERPDKAIVGQAEIARLQELLESGLVVVAADAVLADVRDERRELTDYERARRLDAAVEVNRGEQRLVAVGEQRLLSPAAGLFLAPPEQQVRAEIQPFGLARERGGGHERGFGLRLLARSEERRVGKGWRW